MAATEDGAQNSSLYEHSADAGRCFTSQNDGIGYDAAATQYTNTLRDGLDQLSFESRQINNKIDDLHKYGLNFIDGLRDQFILKMDEMREQVAGYNQMKVEEWTKLSAETLQLQQQVENAKRLVGQFEKSVAHYESI